jgi:hypothetical protein
MFCEIAGVILIPQPVEKKHKTQYLCGFWLAGTKKSHERRGWDACEDHFASL